MTIYGQEKDNATWALSKMNMILHGNEIADIRKGDTITNPQFTQGAQLRTFDFVVMNPPFSIKSWSNGLENDYGRFEFGMPPPKNGDYAFLLHALKSLKSTGKAAVILPHGVLFRGNAEATIRKALLQRGYIKGVIGLPPNLFYGTGIPACIVVLDKEDAQSRAGIFMIDASKGFMKDGAKNRLRSQDLHKIVDVFNNQIEIARYSRMVPLPEIVDSRNDFNLNIPRYIDSSAPDDIQDLHAHLHGGIPERDVDALNRYWHAFPKLRSQLFKLNRHGYVDLAMDVTDVQQAVLDSAEFKKFAKEIASVTRDWYETNRPALDAITKDTRPNDLIASISEDLLVRFKPVPLLDTYDVYEQLMTYWHSVMHDDVFLVMHEGWVEAARPRPTIEDKDRKLSEEPDLEIGVGRKKAKYKMDLIPPRVVVGRYLSDEQAQADDLNTKAEAATQAVDEYVEDNGGEEGPLAAALDDGKISKTLATARLREAKQEGPDPDEIKALERLIQLYSDEGVAKSAAKEAQTDLDTATLKRYAGLTETDVRALVIDAKWAATISDRVVSEVNALTLALVERIQELGERYAQTVGDMDREVQMINPVVADHLREMGFQ